MSVAEAEVHEIQLDAPTGLWREAWRRIIRNPGAIIGMVFIAALDHRRGLRAAHRAA